MVVEEGLLSAARFALRVVACGHALSLALESNPGRSFSSFPAWAEYLIADSFESSRTFESDGGGEGLLSAARFALRVVACGNALSLALESNLGRSFSSFPAWAEYLIADSFESSRTFESDGGGGKDYSALRASPFGSLPAATLSRWRSSRTLVEASHPSPLGQNI